MSWRGRGRTTGRGGFTVLRFAAGAGLIVATAGATGVAGVPQRGTAAAGRYIVRSVTSASAARAVGAAGGTVLAQLPIIDGVDAHLGAGAVQRLSQDASVSLTPDVTMTELGQSYDAGTLAPQLARMDPGSTWSPDAGAGVGVALLDTGVSPSPGLDPAHVVRSPDFSGSGNVYDGYGHGTFMAGLIAGDGAGGTGAVPGSAPGATLVSVKVGGDDGTTTLSQVIVGIAWSIAHRNAYNIRVMSLSFGADFSVPPSQNPLDLAVEAAWNSGIAVVAAAGNGGAGQVTSPGDDPAVISVGAETTTGAVQAPTWSSSSSTKPDVLAPGVSVVSLRDPGSVIDDEYPSARVGDAYFVGTGTSMSTALTAGAVADLLADHPAATPSQVKAALVSTDGPALSGPAGPVDVSAADGAPAWSEPSTTVSGQGSESLAGGVFGGLSDGGVSMTSMRWDSMRWDSMRWDSMRWDSMRWDSMRWDASSWTDQSWGG